MLALSREDYLWFVDQALDAMVAIVTELGDDRANQPPVAGANAPYAILTHCLGVMDFWGGVVIAGRPVERDRDAEFRARGRPVDLATRTDAARRQLERDLAEVDAAAPPRLGPVVPEDAGTPLAASQGGVLLHLLRELTQHLGQMEVSRDLLVADAGDGRG